MTDTIRESQYLLRTRGKTSSWCNQLFCDPTSTQHRYLFMFLMCFANIGDYFMYDNPAALEDHFLRDLHISETSYMGFYASYQWTSMVFCTVGGYLVDKFFSYSTSFAVLAFAITLCQAAFALGAFWNSYWLMYLSRALYGVVDSPFGVVVNGISVKWFQGKELNLVFSLKTSFGRVGAMANMYVMDPIYDKLGNYFSGYRCLGMTLMTCAALCLACALVSTFIAYLDKIADKKLKRDKITKKSKDVRLTGILHFKATYWLIATTTGVYSLAFFPFVGLGKVFFESKYMLEPAAADTLNGMPFLVAAIILPIVGISVDKTGRNLSWMLFGLMFILSSHIYFTFTTLYPYIGACLLGMGYSIMTCVMWPMVSEVVEDRYLGTAYGIMATIVALLGAGGNYATGYIADNYGYFLLEIFYTVCACVAMMFGILLTLVDNIQGGYLNCGRGNKPKAKDMTL